MILIFPDNDVGPNIKEFGYYTKVQNNVYTCQASTTRIWCPYNNLLPGVETQPAFDTGEEQIPYSS